MKKQSDPIVAKEVLLPFILITSLFAFWGFANDITNPMVSAFKKVLELNNKQASLVQMAFYGGYFTMALPAAFIAQKYSYKMGILVGLGLYAFGALMFWPAAAYQQYVFFLIALYVLTFGLAFLETTANPFILSMGSEETATRRLNLAQAFNPMGSLTGLFIAQTFILGALKSDNISAGTYAAMEEAQKASIRASDLAVIRNPYVAIGLVIIILFLVIAFVRMPKIETSQVKGNPRQIIKDIFKKSKFRDGVLAQMFYVGAQIMLWTYLYQYAETLSISNKEAVKYAYWSLGLFLMGRWIATFLMRKIYAGKLMAVMSTICVFLLLVTIFQGGMIGLYCLVACSFFMSLNFPTIYGIALEDLKNDEAKFGAAFLVMAIVGGAVMPFIQGSILDWGGTGYNDVKIWGVSEINFSFFLPLLCFLIVILYAIKSFTRYKKTA